MRRTFKTLAIFLLLTATCLAGNDPNGNELSQSIVIASDQDYPTNLHYEADIAFNSGKMALTDVRVDNFRVAANSYEGKDAKCYELGTDRIPSKYSENAAAVLWQYPDENYLQNIGEYGICRQTLNNTRDTEYYLEMQNASGAFLLSCSFTFTIATQCFDCESKDQGKSSHCESNDRFDFFLNLPYHEDAKNIKIFEVGKDKKKKTVLSIGVSKFKNAAKEFSESG